MRNFVRVLILSTILAKYFMADRILFKMSILLTNASSAVYLYTNRNTVLSNPPNLFTVICLYYFLISKVAKPCL